MVNTKEAEIQLASLEEDSMQNKPAISGHIIVQKRVIQSNDVVLPCNPENTFFCSLLSPGIFVHL